jgi:hypothetical protein
VAEKNRGKDFSILPRIFTNIKLQHPVALCRSDFAFCFFAVCAMSVNILLSFSLYCYYMFQPNWPSAGVQIVVMNESAAHCNAVMLFLCSCLGF